MSNPLIGKLPGKVISKETADKPFQKQGPSKFDSVRSNLESRQSTSQVQLPPEIKTVSMDQQKTLESDLRKRLQQGAGRPSPEIYRPEISKIREGVERVRQKVEALPKQSAFEPLRLRFNNVESMFKQAGSLVQGINSTYSPAEMMKVQIQMYQLTENLELLVKAVEQTNTGVKTILQTQV